MLRVLYVINNLDVGGAERHLLQVLPRLSEHGIEPRVYVIGSRGRLAPLFENAGVPVIAPPFSEFLSGLPGVVRMPVLTVLSALRLLVLLWTMRPAIVHFFLPHAYILGGAVSLLAWGRLRVMSRRSLNDYQQRHPFTAKIERLLHPVLDAALANSRKVLSQLAAEGIDERRLGLIYNGVTLADHRDPKAASKLREQLGVAQDALVMVHVANLIPYKGHADLLEALGRVHPDMPKGWRLLCVGRDTGIGADLKREAEKLGISEHILWLGERGDARDFFAASDIGLLPSHEEGFSNSILEGMTAGLPMIVTDVGGNPESVVHEETGLVVPPHDPVKLGQAIRTLSKSGELRKTYGAAGRARVERSFTIEACVSKYASFYKGVFSGNETNVQDIIDRD